MRTLLHRRLIVELGRSSAPGRPFLYGTGFDFLERFGLTSLEELPPLDTDVAARLAEEGGEPMTEPLFEADTPDAADAAPRARVSPADESFEIEAARASDPPEAGTSGAGPRT